MKYYYGKVTMYTDFNVQARDYILSFLKYYFPDPKKLVTPIHSVEIKTDVTEFLKEIEGKDYKEFIRTHTNIYDFCAAVKKKSNFKILQHFYKNNSIETVECGKVTRYYVSKKGSYLIKSYDDGRESKIEAGYKSTILNRIVDENALNYDIDYSYYELAVAEIIQSIESNNKQLTMF